MAKKTKEKSSISFRQVALKKLIYKIFYSDRIQNLKYCQSF